MEKLLIPPDQSGYSVADSHALQYQPLDGGRGRQRADVLNDSVIVNLQWTVRQENYNKLLAFYKAYLGRNCEPFLLDLISATDALQEYTVLGILSFTPIGTFNGLTFVVKAQLEIKPNDAESDAWAVNLDWTNQTLPFTGAWEYTAWSEELEIYCAVSTTAYAAISSDGVTWTAYPMPFSADWSRVIWAKELSKFVAIAYNTNKGAISNDGKIWVAFTLPASKLWSGLGWNGSTFVLMSGTQSDVLTSPDGLNWTVRNNVLPSAAWDGVIWAPQLGLFCTVASFTSYSATSPDGITWTTHTLPGATYWREITWSGTLFVVTDYSTSNHCATSPDGVTWTSRLLPITTKWGSVCWNNTRQVFCMVGDGGNSLLSKNGIEWQSSPMASTLNWYAVVWGRKAGKFVALANSSTNIANVKQYDDIKLNLKPDQTGYAVQPNNNLLIANPEGPGGKYARNQFNNSANVSARWICSKQEYTYLAQCYRSAVHNGGLTFRIDLIVDHSDTLTEYRAQFVPGTFKLSSVQGETYVAEAVLEIKPETYDVINNPFVVDPSLSDRRLIAAGATFLFVGIDSNVKFSSTHLSHDSGSFIFTGVDVRLFRGRVFDATSYGSFAFSGADAGFFRSLDLMANQGSFAISSPSIALTYVPIVGNRNQEDNVARQWEDGTIRYTE